MKKLLILIAIYLTAYVCKAQTPDTTGIKQYSVYLNGYYQTVEKTTIVPLLVNLTKCTTLQVMTRYNAGTLGDFVCEHKPTLFWYAFSQWKSKNNIE